MYVYKGPEYQAIASWVAPFTDKPTFNGRKNRTYNSSLINQIKDKITSWSNICIAGGAVLNHIKGYKADDVDFYVVGCANSVEYGEVVRRLLKCFDTITGITSFSVSGLLNGIKVQLILDHSSNINQVVGPFDIPACKLVYRLIDGDDVINCTKDFIECFETKVITVDLLQVSNSYDTRLFKYYSKGFSIHFPKVDKACATYYTPGNLSIADLNKVSPRRLFKRVYMGKEALETPLIKDYTDYDRDLQDIEEGIRGIILEKVEEKKRLEASKKLMLSNLIETVNWDLFYYRNQVMLLYINKITTTEQCYMDWQLLITGDKVLRRPPSIPEFDRVLRETELSKLMKKTI